jgi:DNA-binding response OmpR family regulator
MAHALGQGTRYLIGPLDLAPDDMLVDVAGRRVWLTRRELRGAGGARRASPTPGVGAAIHRHARGAPVAEFKNRSVEVYIHRLRVKLGAAAPQWEWIHTHHAIGYRLAPEPQEDRS